MPPRSRSGKRTGPRHHLCGRVAAARPPAAVFADEPL